MCVSQNFAFIKMSRSNHRRCSVRRGVLRNFTKFTGKHLCQSPFLTKLQAWGIFLNKNAKNELLIHSYKRRHWKFFLLLICSYIKKRCSLVNENSSFQNNWWLESKELQMSKNWNFHIFAWPDVKNLDVCQNAEACNVWK